MLPRGSSWTTRSARASAAICVATAVLWVGAPRPAAACSCAPKPPPPAAKLRADAVFEGRVYAVEAAGVGQTRYNFEVDRFWKGALPERIAVLSNTQSSACGRTFELGRSYLVYARGSDDSYTDTICSRTRPAVAAAEDLATLGEPATPAVPGTPEAGLAGQDTPPQEPPRVAPVGDAPAPIAPPARGCSVSRGPERDGLVRWSAVLVLALLGSRRRR